MTQRRRRNFKRVEAISVPHAMEVCIQHAQQELNLSVIQVAELMGEESYNTLYKWLASGRMPTIKIRAFENACGLDAVTRYLAHSDNLLAVRMPTGRRAQHKELSDLNVAANTVINQLFKFYEGEIEADETINVLTLLIEDLAYQRGNVERHRQPDLDLLGENA